MEAPMNTESIIAFLNNRYSESPGWCIEPESTRSAVYGNFSNGIELKVYEDDELPYCVDLFVDIGKYIDQEDLTAEASSLDEALDQVEIKLNALIQNKIEELEAFKFKKK